MPYKAHYPTSVAVRHKICNGQGLGRWLAVGLGGPRLFSAGLKATEGCGVGAGGVSSAYSVSPRASVATGWVTTTIEPTVINSISPGWMVNRSVGAPGG